MKFKGQNRAKLECYHIPV